MLYKSGDSLLTQFPKLQLVPKLSLFYARQFTKFNMKISFQSKVL